MAAGGKGRLQQRFLRRGLRFQVTGLVLLISTIILSLFGWQTIELRSRNLQKNLSQSLTQYSYWLATALELPLYNFDDEVVAALGKAMVEQQDIVKITLSANSHQSVYLNPSYTDMVLAEDDLILLNEDIVHNGIKLGKLEVTATTMSLKHQKRLASLFILLQILLLDLCQVICILFFLGKRVIKPVEHLQSAAASIASGDLTGTISSKSGNELQGLAVSLERMRKTLQEKISALEKEVQERQRAEGELSTALNAIDNIIDAMPSLLIGVDRDGMIRYWNLRAEEVTGIPAIEAKGCLLQDISIFFKDLAGKIREAVDSGEPIFEKARMTIEKDVKRYQDITIYPLPKSNGDVVIRIDDVTQQYLMQEELIHSRKLDAIGQLAGGVAHDFNNMLGGILGGAELLEVHLQDDEKAMKLLGLIIQSGRRVTDLNRKLLSFARRDRMESVDVDVSQAIENTIDILSHSLDKRIRISTDFRTSSTVVRGDLSQLQNAFLNLGINAGHAMEEGGELVYCVEQVSLDREYCTSSTFKLEPGNYLDIEIRDTGKGIAFEHQHRIFDPFFTTKEQGKGTGLGLASVYGTVVQHNGAITVYSEVGKGTTFHIYLPLNEYGGPVIVADEEPALSGSGLVMVVDDESVIRETAAAMLEKMGYNVIVETNGADAVARFKELRGQVDLVVMDMIMPMMSGKECFLAMKEESPDVRVVIASGFLRGEDIDELKALGLRGFLRKPFSSSELSRAVAAGMQDVTEF